MAIGGVYAIEGCYSFAVAGKPEPATKCKRELSEHFVFDKAADSFLVKGGVELPQVRSFSAVFHNLFIFL